MEEETVGLLYRWISDMLSLERDSCCVIVHLGMAIDVSVSRNPPRSQKSKQYIGSSTLKGEGVCGKDIHG